MIFTPTALEGVWIIDQEPRYDERGYFSRTFCEAEFATHGLNTEWRQNSNSFSKRKGIVRGLHYQAAPKPEIKLVRCVTGAIFDVVVDIRPTSPTFGQWCAYELSRENHRQLYIPEGFAHGFQCLTDDCEVYYQMSALFDAQLNTGVRWNDPDIGIAWPFPDEAFLSDRDAALPSLSSLL